MSETVMENTANEYLHHKKFEVMLDMATKRLMNEISTLKETVNKLTDELNVLKNKVHRQDIKAPAAPVQSMPEEQKEMKFTNSTDSEKITENDVSIEKFFYCGKK